MFTLIALTCMLALAAAYPGYEDAIPNGHSVPDPCNPGSVWTGVGHYKARGTGERNAFGDAFAAEGHIWTEALCKADSDRDGVSNGEELGDLHCHWSVDKNTHLNRAKSHPGICEPIGSSQCSWQSAHVNCH